MVVHGDFQVAHCPTLFLLSIWQGPSLASCPGGTILCQWLLLSYCPLLQRISSVPGWSMVLCCIDQSQCFQMHVYNNNNFCLYYLECRACLGPHSCYIFKSECYVRRNSYALLTSLKCSWDSYCVIGLVVGLYLSGWYIRASRLYCTFISLYVAEKGNSNIPR